MEFETLQQTWKNQDTQQAYIINEPALYDQIQRKKRGSGRLASFTEKVLIGSNLLAAGFILAVSMYKQSTSVFPYLIAGWMIISVFYIIIKHFQRKIRLEQYDSSILGSLDHAISNATSQLYIARVSRWNVIPVGGLALFSLIMSGSSPLFIALVVAFFGLGFYASGWENKSYIARKHALDKMREKLIEAE
jgi:hypothetical protein